VTAQDLKAWLTGVCANYQADLRGVFQQRGTHPWPLVAQDAADLEAQLSNGGHLLPLPKESAALANILEVSIVDFLIDQIASVEGAVIQRGTERGYPDIELSGPTFGGGFHAVDVKVARRKPTSKGMSKNTQSRVTLYTGNTYFRYPKVHWPGTFRPFQDYKTHLDIVVIYTLDTDSNARAVDLEPIVQEPWRIGSTTRSSTTREYIGAVMNIDDLRHGRGEFETQEDFYKYWRKYPFKIGAAVQQHLDKLLAGDQLPKGQLAPLPPDLA